MNREQEAARPFVQLGDRAQSDEVYRRLLDAAPDAVIVVDEMGRIVLANKQTERLFGYHSHELIGERIEVLVPERFRETHHGHRNRFFSVPKVRPMGTGLDLFGRKHDGSEFPVEISLSPLPTDEGTLISASIRDITERKQSEREIRRIQEHLLSSVESIQGAFAIFDVNDRLVLCNSMYRQMFGHRLAGDIVGLSLEDLMDAGLGGDFFGLDDATLLAVRDRLIENRNEPASTIDVRSSNGSRYRIFERKTAEHGMVMTIWDVTEDVVHEEELRRAHATAEAASSAKSEFLASMSHELRTPLNAILGFAQLLQRDKKTPLSQRQQERIEHVLKGGEHLMRLIDDVLDLSRIEAGGVSVSPEPIHMVEVLAEVKTTLDPMASRAGVELVVAPIPATAQQGVADLTRFKQILMNFGSNAIKYGRRGGTTTFRIDAHRDAIRVTVIDDGIGIPEDKQHKIFQPFQRAGQETGPIEGTGIGLAITRRLADLMRGKVGFRSSEGQGSEFWIEIPIYQPEVTADRNLADSITPENSLRTARGRTHLVVYIEDNPSNLAFMEDLISDFASLELVTAPTAEIGIEIVRARRPDVVIMDINLPGMSGFEAARRLGQWVETQDIPVIALSAAAMVRDKAQINEAGFFRYLTKPVKVDELAQVLEELIVPNSR